MKLHAVPVRSGAPQFCDGLEPPSHQNGRRCMKNETRNKKRQPFVFGKEGNRERKFNSQQLVEPRAATAPAQPPPPPLLATSTFWQIFSGHAHVMCFCCAHCFSRLLSPYKQRWGSLCKRSWLCVADSTQAIRTSHFDAFAMPLAVPNLPPPQPPPPPPAEEHREKWHC